MIKSAFAFSTLAYFIAAAPHAMSAETDAALQQRVARVLTQTPLIDGHNDLPEALRGSLGSKMGAVDLAKDSRTFATPLHTDLARLKQGMVGGQFWSVWVSAELSGPVAVQTTLEQIDLVKLLVAKYPRDLAMAYTADDIVRIHKTGRVASLIGVEGGHQINNSLGTLRQMHALGARYMTLTHTLNNDWADAATDTPMRNGLTPFGKALVLEMNRLGMLIDLSHVSPEVMRQALTTTKAPVIFSHSGARAINDHPRNVPDDMLKLTAQNGGVVMVNFYSGYVSEALRVWAAAREAEKARYNAPPYGGLFIGQPGKATAALAAWEKANPKPLATLAQVADHLDHIRSVAGIDHVGLGSDFDGVDILPEGLSGVQTFPALLVELARRGWSDADLAKVAGGNVLRVMRAAEKVAAGLQKTQAPSLATVDGK
jgi:membrane dipeptidase